MSASGDGSAINLITWQGLGFDSHSQVADALGSIFVKPETNNFELKAGSQAIDAGTNLVNSIVINDYNGSARPVGSNYDIGAFEFGAVLSVNDFNFAEVIIFPNPITNELFIKYNETSVDVKGIKLFDVNGKLIKSFKPNHLLHVEGMSSGLYFVDIQLENDNVIRKKIIIR